MTPFEVSLQIEAWRDQREEDFKRDLVLAWHIAALQRVARLPALKVLLEESSSKPLSGEAAARLQARHEQLIREMEG